MTLSLHCTVKVWCFFKLAQTESAENCKGAKGVSMVHLYIGLFLS